MKMASIQQPLSPEALPSPLSSRPERTRISCLAPLDKTARAPFFKERRIQFASATNFYRKSGGAERRDLCVDASSWKCFSTVRSRGICSPADLPWKTQSLAPTELSSRLPGVPENISFQRLKKTFDKLIVL
jgi:hypothetical protein